MADNTVGLTVAIATLNRPEGLARCLDAILAGDALPAEIVVVDQSRDGATRALIEARAADPVPIIYVHQARRGLSASRNAALEQAGCPMVAMTDDDCVPDAGWVAALGRAFAAPTAPAAVTGRILPLGPEVPGLYAVSSREGTVAAEFKGKTRPWLAGSGGNFAVRRECWLQIGPYDERLGAGSPGKSAEDMDFVYRLLRSGFGIRYEPAVLIFHERQERARRIASRWGYGYGMGAFCGKWLRRRDLYALRLLGSWLVWRSRELWGSLRARDWPSVRERWLMLAGTVRGWLYGLSLGGKP